MLTQTFFYFSTYKRFVSRLIPVPKIANLSPEIIRGSGALCVLSILFVPPPLTCYQVAVLFFSDTLNSIFNMWWIYNVLINNFGTSGRTGILDCNVMEDVSIHSSYQQAT